MSELKAVGKFEKVSYEQFAAAMNELPFFVKDEDVKQIYDEIKLPKRATTGSAGYDFFAPFDFGLSPGQTIKFPTGIRVHIEDGWVLECVTRSSLGFEFRLQLDNTIGIIDSDYYYSDNEGQIFVKLTNDSKSGKILYVSRGEGFMQGIFHEFGITVDDDATEIRNGGFGSTNNKQ